MKFTLSVRSFQVSRHARQPAAWAAEFAFRADFREPTRVTFAGERVELVDPLVLMVFFSSRISPFTSTVIFSGQVAAGNGRGHLSDVAHLPGEISGHRVDRVSKGPFHVPAHPRHVRLSSQPALCTGPPEPRGLLHCLSRCRNFPTMPW